MIIDYNKVEIINFKDYKIDHIKNINIIILFEKLLIDNKKLNLPFLIGGGLSFLLKYNKIYRTIEDIDLIINNIYFSDWEMYLKNSLGFKKYESFDNVHRYKNIKNNSLLIDLITKHNIKNYETININDHKTIKTNNWKLTYNSDCKFYNCEYIVRKKDYDDFEFFNTFIKTV